MTPEYTESTPLLSTSAISSHDENDTDNGSVTSVDFQDQHLHPRLANSYRRPSYVLGGRGLLLSSSPVPEAALRDDEAFDCVREERDLLKGSNVEFPHRRSRRSSIAASVIEDVEETWEEAVKSGRVKTSWKYELSVITRYSVQFRHECG